MVASGCGCCLKITVFAANIILLLIGAAMVAIGAWMIARPDQFIAVVSLRVPAEVNEMTRGYQPETLKVLGIIGIASGGVLFIAGVLGCAGALSEKAPVLAINILLLLLLFIGILFLVFFVFLFGEELKFTHHYSFFREKEYRQLVIKKMEEEIASGETDGLLVTSNAAYGCCGIYAVPGGMCNQTVPPSDKCVSGSLSCDKGCLEPVSKTMKEVSFGIGIAVLVTGGILLIGILLSCIQCCSLRSRASDYLDE